MSDTSDPSGEDDDYFEDLDDGCGCAELWEYMSERRREESATDG